ncbi:MAG: hypothetical protein K2P07_03375 [Lachnospiraceae bacterium]|nr:hypothetical protein [Lachnospiraceae bacterium]MDE7007192.1 hypothetical protein [Lachnospiraceae bacterium]
MTTLLVAKQYIKNFINKYEVYLKPLMKLTLALASLMMINSKIGYMHRLDNLSIVLIIALMCSFMPMNFIAFVAAGFIILHFYALSLECAAVTLVLFLVMFLLYFRFSPKDTLVVVLLPICFVLKIPYVIPLAMGLLGTPASVVSTGCGVMVNYLVNYMSDNATAISAMGEEEITTKLRYIIDGLMDNREMLLTIAAFAITIIVVYIIRRLSVDHAWTIAMIGGAIVNVVVLLVGDLMFDTNVSIVGIFVGTIISLLIVKVLEFFVFHLDYNRVEKVQFEDDEYYYYVKAVPKITMAAPSKTVKRINTPRRKSGGSQSKH